MKQRPRIYYTETQKALMWERRPVAVAPFLYDGRCRVCPDAFFRLCGKCSSNAPTQWVAGATKLTTAHLPCSVAALQGDP